MTFRKLVKLDREHAAQHRDDKSYCANRHWYG
jgi:hypothetical protein